MAGTIYLVTNNLNGKQYVGQTTTGDRRGHGTLVTKAYKKYGKENFDYEVICSGLDNQPIIDFAERFWVNVMGCRIPNGYNIEFGGAKRNQLAPETIAKMKVAQLGWKRSPEAIEKVSEALRNRSPELKKQIGDKLRGKKRPAHIGEITKKVHTGKVVSEETKAKLSAFNKGKIVSEETKQKLSEAAKRQWAKIKGEA